MQKITHKINGNTKVDTGTTEEKKSDENESYRMEMEKNEPKNE